MLNYVREGGYSMLLIILVAIVTAVVAAVRPTGRQREVLFAGAIAALAAGMLGLASGLQAVAAAVPRFANPIEALCVGLRELSYNGVFSAMVAAALALAALVVKQPEAK
jgi:hypothetical protein